MPLCIHSSKEPTKEHPSTERVALRRQSGCSNTWAACTVSQSSTSHHLQQPKGLRLQCLASKHVARWADSDPTVPLGSHTARTPPQTFSCIPIGFQGLIPCDSFCHTNQNSRPPQPVPRHHSITKDGRYVPPGALFIQTLTPPKNNVAGRLDLLLHKLGTGGVHSWQGDRFAHPISIGRSKGAMHSPHTSHA